MTSDCKKFDCCVLLPVILCVIVGVVGAFLYLTGAILMTNRRILALLAIAAFYLGVALHASATARRPLRLSGGCGRNFLTGVIGTFFVSGIFLLRTAVFPIVLESVFGGIILFFAALMFIGTVGLLRSVTRTETEPHE